MKEHKIENGRWLLRNTYKRTTTTFIGRRWLRRRFYNIFFSQFSLLNYAKRRLFSDGFMKSAAGPKITKQKFELEIIDAIDIIFFSRAHLWTHHTRQMCENATHTNRSSIFKPKLGYKKWKKKRSELLVFYFSSKNA